MFGRFFKDLFSPILSDRAIQKYIERGMLVRTPIQPYQLQPNSVDLTLGGSYRIPQPNHKTKEGRAIIDPRQPPRFSGGNILREPGEKPQHLVNCYIIEPGDFVLMTTEEYLFIPEGIMGFIAGRSSIARLSIHIESGGLCDSGFQGTVSLQITNLSAYPVVLYPDMRIVQVWFIKSQYAKTPYSIVRGSKYNTQVGATESRIHLDQEFNQEKTNNSMGKLPMLLFP